MKDFLILGIKKIINILLAAGVLWLIVLPIFTRLDERTPWFVALLLTYLISAYLIMPRVIRVFLLIYRRGKIPRFTTANDGYYVDPVNIILIGNKKQLENTFKKIGWEKADKLTIKSMTKMIRTFLTNKSYSRAPFSNLYLFGRKQDVGFQQTIGNSPRKRHHIRFWALNMDKIIDPMDLKFWTKKQVIKKDESFMWVGAGSKDIGFGFRRLTYQITHQVDHEVDKERNYILDLLKNSGCIKKINFYKSGSFKIGKYVSDGKIVVAKLEIKNE